MERWGHTCAKLDKRGPTREDAVGNRTARTWRQNGELANVTGQRQRRSTDHASREKLDCEAFECRKLFASERGLRRGYGATPAPFHKSRKVLTPTGVVFSELQSWAARRM